MKKYRVLVIGCLLLSLIIGSCFTTKQVSASGKKTYMILTSSIKTFKKSKGSLTVKCTSDAPIMCKSNGKWKDTNKKTMKVKLSKKVKWKNGSKKTSYSWIKRRIKLDYDYEDLDSTGALYVEVKNKKASLVMVYWDN